jgi:hypothetical protein
MTPICVSTDLLGAACFSAAALSLVRPFSRFQYRPASQRNQQAGEVAHVLSSFVLREAAVDASSFRILLQPAGLQGGEVLKPAMTKIEEHPREIVQAENNHNSHSQHQGRCR